MPGDGLAVFLEEDEKENNQKDKEKIKSSSSYVPLDQFPDNESTENESTENESTESNPNENNSEERALGEVLPIEIIALLTVILGPGINELDSQKLQSIVEDFGEKIKQILAVAAVVMKIPGASSNPTYQELIESDSTNSNEN
jgi:hypothetical protein